MAEPNTNTKLFPLTNTPIPNQTKPHTRKTGTTARSARAPFTAPWGATSPHQAAAARASRRGWGGRTTRPWRITTTGAWFCLCTFVCMLVCIRTYTPALHSLTPSLTRPPSPHPPTHTQQTTRLGSTLAARQISLDVFICNALHAQQPPEFVDLATLGKVSCMYIDKCVFIYM